MTRPSWQPHLPMDCVIFDCDGTLSSIEGIDVLAEHNNVGHRVIELTATAMNTTGMNVALYEQRLNLTNPSIEQLITLGEEYKKHCVTDAREVIQLFKKLNKSIYIVSAGLTPAVKIFGEWLDISEKNIFAVDIFFDKKGNYKNFDRESALVNRHGKRLIIAEIKKNHARSIYLGDGLNDYEAHDLVTRFVGYGGQYYRQKIEDLCQFYIRTPTITPLLSLTLTAEEQKQLNSVEQELYMIGMTEITEGKVKVSLYNN